MSAIEDEDFNEADLHRMTRSELMSLGIDLLNWNRSELLGLTKVDLIAALLNDRQPQPSPDSILAEALRVRAQTQQWLRGVPPGEACLKVEDKRWLASQLL